MKLRTIIASFGDIQSAASETRRRRSNLVVLGVALAALSLIFSVFTLVRGDSIGNVALLVGATLIFLASAALGRAGKVNRGAWLLILAAIVGTLNFLTATQSSLSVTSFLVLAVLVAGMLLPPAQIWLVLVMCIVGIPLRLALAGALEGGAVFAQLTSPSLLLGMVALISFVGARGIQTALLALEAARAETEGANQTLSATNMALEERTTSLRQTAEQHQAAVAELQTSLRAQQELNRIIADLSVPVIPISADTLIVPLIGNIDSARAQQLLAAILARIEGAGARTVVLDVTGVAIVDSYVAGSLLRVAQAARLMGARTVLAGIRPEMAQALVSLGVDLGDLECVATLQEVALSAGRPSR